MSEPCRHPWEGMMLELNRWLVGCPCGMVVLGRDVERLRGTDDLTMQEFLETASMMLNEGYAQVEGK